MNYQKYITYGSTHYWQEGRQVFQAWYAGKTTGTFWTEKRALAKAREIAEAVRQSYMERGIRAQVVRVEPEWHRKESV